MATVDYTVEEVSTRGDHCHILTWVALANGDEGVALQMPGSADRTAQVFGTFGSGGTVRIEGSNNGVNWSPLRDAVYANLDVTAEGVYSIVEVTRYLRPRVTGGDGATALTVALLAREPART